MRLSTNRLREALAEADARASEAADLLVRILAVDTCNPPGRNYSNLVDLLEPEFAGLGMATERIVVPEAIIRQVPLPLEGPRVNLVARWPGDKPTLSVYAHMDTVPYDKAKWRFNPLGEIAEGCVYGRGASDMKGAIAGLIIALRIIRDLDLPVAYRVHALMCTDEEIRVGYPGVKYLAEHGYVDLPLLSMEGRSDPRVETGYVGALSATITVLGHSVHSGRSYLGINAIEASVPILEELLTLKGHVAERESQHRAEPDAPTTFRQPVLNLTIIHGGIADNIVPDRCTLVIDRRYIPEERLEDVEAEIVAAVRRGQERSPAQDVRIDFGRGYPPMTINMESVHVRRMIQARVIAQGYRPEDFIFYMSYGSSDIAEVQKVLGSDQFVVAGLGGLPSNRGHGVDENVTIDQLRDFVKVLVCYLTDNDALAAVAP